MTIESQNCFQRGSAEGFLTEGILSSLLQPALEWIRCIGTVAQWDNLQLGNTSSARLVSYQLKQTYSPVISAFTDNGRYLTEVRELKQRRRGPYGQRLVLYFRISQLIWSVRLLVSELAQAKYVMQAFNSKWKYAIVRVCTVSRWWCAEDGKEMYQEL